MNEVTLDQESSKEKSKVLVLPDCTVDPLSIEESMTNFNDSFSINKEFETG